MQAAVPVHVAELTNFCVGRRASGDRPGNDITEPERTRRQEVNARNFNLQSIEKMLGCQLKVNQGGHVMSRNDMADVSSFILS